MGEQLVEGHCVVCGLGKKVIVLATGTICPECDSEGRIRSAREAFAHNRHQADVRRGYESVRGRQRDASNALQGQAERPEHASEFLNAARGGFG